MGKVGFSHQEVGAPAISCANDKPTRYEDLKKKKEIIATISFRIAVFYDGTGNNKLNTVSRRMVVSELPKEERDNLGELGNEVLSKEQKNEENNELATAYAYLSKEELDKRIESGKENFNKKRIKGNSKGSGSYLGSETNVYKMFRELELTECKPKSKEFKGTSDWFVNSKIYIEGIGTISGIEVETLKGGGLARGESGIIKRVIQARDRVIDFIKNKVDTFRQSLDSDFNLTEIKIENIYLDFFGFSRGAACARYSCKVFKDGDSWVLSTLLVDPIKSVKDSLSELFEGSIVKLSFDNVVIKKVGIFDTVVSHGILGTAGEISDSWWMGQKSITLAESVFHITAEDEYRKNFALTNNNSNAGGKSLPGAHSDIGGGYNSVESEEYKPILNGLLFSEAVKIAFWFKKNGWVEKVFCRVSKGKGIEINDDTESEPKGFRDIREDDYSIILDRYPVLDSITQYRFNIILKRSEVYNDYSKIPLNMMIDNSEGSGLFFNKSKKDVNISSSKEMMQLKSAIESEPKDQETIKFFRKKFMHFSADASFVNDPREPGILDILFHVEKAPFKRKIHNG